MKANEVHILAFGFPDMSSETFYRTQFSYLTSKVWNNETDSWVTLLVLFNFLFYVHSREIK